jgi:hypothetical protein
MTVAEPDPAGFSSVVIFAGHGPIVGGSVSLTVMLKLHDWSGLLPLAAVQVTSVVPFGKVCGEVIVVAPILQVTVGAGQPAVAVGGVNVTDAEHCPGSVLTV